MGFLKEEACERERRKKRGARFSFSIGIVSSGEEGGGAVAPASDPAPYLLSSYSFLTNRGEKKEEAAGGGGGGEKRHRWASLFPSYPHLPLYHVETSNRGKKKSLIRKEKGERGLREAAGIFYYFFSLHLFN